MFMTTQMSISFTAEEKQQHKCKVFEQNIDPRNMNESVLPTDIHLIEYEVDGNLYVDMVRAHKAADIFDPYYDKLKSVGGTIKAITNGYGNIKPNLYNPNPEKKG